MCDGAGSACLATQGVRALLDVLKVPWPLVVLVWRAGWLVWVRVLLDMLKGAVGVADGAPLTMQPAGQGAVAISHIWGLCFFFFFFFFFNIPWFWVIIYASILGRMNTHVPPMLIFTKDERF